MTITYIEKQDKNFVLNINKHVTDTGYDTCVDTKTGYVMWENDMKQQGYKMTLISTQVDEGAQYLYRKPGISIAAGWYLIIRHLTCIWRCFSEKFYKK